MNSQVQGSAMSTIIVLAAHEQIANLLPKYRVPELVASFVLAPDYEVYRENFLDRFPAGLTICASKFYQELWLRLFVWDERFLCSHADFSYPELPKTFSSDMSCEVS
jgi:hypothetical protein